MSEFDFEVISHSMLSDVYGCPWKYVVYTVLGIEAEKKEYPLVKGIILHDAFEDVINWLEEESGAVPIRYQIAEAQHILDNVIKEYFGEEVISKLLEYELEYENALDEVREHGLREYKRTYVKPESTKRFKELYEPHLAKRRRELNSLVTDVVFQSATIVSLHQRAREQMNNFVRMHHRVNGYNKIYTEISIRPRIELFGAKIGGRVDRIEEYDDFIDVYDYKTGASLYSMNQVANNDQLHWYAYASERICEKPVRYIGIWNTHNSTISKHEINKIDRELFLKRWETNISYKKRMDEEIKSAIIKVLGKEDGFTKQELFDARDAILKEIKGVLFVPAGIPLRFGCPCPALWEGHCPYMTDYENRM